MALNVTFTCNSIYDELGNPINCKYQAYYPEHGVWNTVRNSELYQYNCNAGDADSLTQTGSLLAGEHIILAFWQGDGVGGLTGPDRTGLKDRMSYFVITHDGITNTYIIDVELRPKTAPDCSWYLTSSATINRNVTAYSYATDDFLWTYGGHTMYHYNKYSGTVIFDSIGSLGITFDFGEGAGFAAINTHTYLAMADYIASHKALNQYSLSSTCTRPIRLKYNTPIGGITFTPDGITTGSELQKGDLVTTTAGIIDEDSRITGIDHHWIIKDRTNNTTIIRDTLVATNTLLNYSYDSTLLELQDTFAYQYITWNDGWNNFTITNNKELQVKNISPTVTIDKLDLSTKDKRFSQVSSDLDGTVISWNWKVYLLMPFSGAWVEVFQTTTNGSPLDITFNEAGTYKTEITIQDDFGKYSTTNTTPAGTAVASLQFDISAAGTCTGNTAMNEEVFFVFPDVVGDAVVV